MRNTSLVGRIAAIAAVLIVLIAVAVIVLGSGSSYQVDATFINASQIVKGDTVQVGGQSVGSVSKISLSPRGQAVLTLTIKNSDYQPLREGTMATIRATSLTGIANRYVDLRLGASNSAPIKNGGSILADRTTGQVDLDQIFNTLDPPTRKGLQNVIQGSASEYAGKGDTAQLAFQYLNPAVATSSVLFAEINRDTGRFTNFIVKSGNLVRDVASRSTDLSNLIQNLGTTTEALANQRTNLAASIQRLPGFMRLANTTFVNLRGALTDLTALVNVAKGVHVAPKLQQLLTTLRPLARDSVPTVRDLSNIISRPGPDNDLIELTALGVPLANATVRNVNVDGKVRPGAFPESVQALNESTPELAVARPYSVDLTGWFEDFSHPGAVDANGAASRIVSIVNGTSLSSLSTLSSLPLGQQLTAITKQLTQGTGASPGSITSGQGDRCPGSVERGGLWFPESGFPCNPSQTPTGG